MRLIRSTRHPLYAWLLAAVLLAAEIAAFAHLLDHELAKPDGQCAICLHVGQIEKSATTSGLEPVFVPLTIGFVAPCRGVAVLGEAPAPYPARGPPFTSERSVS